MLCEPLLGKNHVEFPKVFLKSTQVSATGALAVVPEHRAVAGVLCVARTQSRSKAVRAAGFLPNSQGFGPMDPSPWFKLQGLHDEPAELP